MAHAERSAIEMDKYNTMYMYYLNITMTRAHQIRQDKHIYVFRVQLLADLLALSQILFRLAIGELGTDSLSPLLLSFLSLLCHHRPHRPHLRLLPLALRLLSEAKAVGLHLDGNWLQLSITLFKKDNSS